MPETKKPSNPSAFAFGYGTDNYSDIQLGMTLRDYFAAKAMNGVVSNEVVREAIAKNASANNIHGDDAIAKASYDLADAMLKQRELNDENK